MTVCSFWSLFRRVWFLKQTIVFDGYSDSIQLTLVYGNVLQRSTYNIYIVYKSSRIIWYTINFQWTLYYAGLYYYAWLIHVVYWSIYCTIIKSSPGLIYRSVAHTGFFFGGACANDNFPKITYYWREGNFEQIHILKGRHLGVGGRRRDPIHPPPQMCGGKWKVPLS